ncbi:protein FAR1-RELATED SEQUENCE 5 [Triticum aestivum]|uniref:protein FAR1-RELATED SEQUENCE 5 n=1 Tax=Triticum aestivum TaxID=4565 RepID=UPI001D0303B4|nr:protein FAR1-RELATED SEQUENCE 5-like [Triticum aestivum]XP_044345304.1 protein FAR1-RELATED SEQUENCE 5-like [Triticum aestivum]XP_044345305.1 protein FAR1-RELATED SEQUENCE 5-like [Triticum aestivum]
MWANENRRLQYKIFGDVVTCETTYRTNLYNMPFGLFVGVNNHFQSIINAGVLVVDETEESFMWAFSEFLRMMVGVAPRTVLIDQNKAMELALNSIMPNTAHRWCKWPVLKKAKKTLGPLYSKKSDFSLEFHKVGNSMLTVDEFEEGWRMLLEKDKLQTHPYMTRLFEAGRSGRSHISKGRPVIKAR